MRVSNLQDYIVFVRSGAARALGAPLKSTQKELRSQRIEQLSKERASQSVFKNTRKWLDSASAEGRVDSRRSTLLHTGVELFSATAEVAQELRSLDSKLQVFQDIELELIVPTLLGDEQAASALDEKWHLEAMRATSPKLSDGDGVTVGVMDSGIHASHPDLEHAVELGFELNDTGVVIPSANIVDSHWHGTHVAGLIAGRHTGIAPGASIVSIRTTKAQRLKLSSLMTTWVEWIAQNPSLDIINFSLGLPRTRFSPPQLEALEESFETLRSVGVLTVAAVGNEGEGIVYAPASVRKVLSVGATNRDGQVWTYSSSGSVMTEQTLISLPQCVAPGVQVVSCKNGGGYQLGTGTSQAAPLISGLAALLLQKFPSLSCDELLEEILARGQQLAGIPEKRQGVGLVLC